MNNHPSKLYGRTEGQTLLNELASKIKIGSRDSKFDEDDKVNESSSSVCCPCQTVLISGPSGSGKTSLCLELQQQCTFPDYLFLMGKFDQYSTDKSSPYLALVQAFDGLLSLLSIQQQQEQQRQDETNHDDEIQTTNASYSSSLSSLLRRKIQTSLQEEAKMLTQVIPSFNRIIRETEESKNPISKDGVEATSTASRSSIDSMSSSRSSENLAATATSERVVVAFCSFLAKFCSEEYPTILVIDDLQWADEDSLDVLNAIIKHSNQGEGGSEITNLLLVGIYRRNDVDDEDVAKVSISSDITEEDRQQPRLANFLRTLHEQRPPNLYQLSTKNLEQHETKSMICDLLSINNGGDDDRNGNSSRQLDPLVELIQRKTLGNPFFVVQFMIMLQQNQLIKLNYASLQWQWDMETIMEAPTTTLADNVATVLSQRIQRLASATDKTSLALRILQLASCLGFAFDIAILEELANDPNILPKTQEKQQKNKETSSNQESFTFAELLGEAVSENLIELSGGGGLATTTLYRFTHDKIHQTIYELVQPSKERHLLHWTIGNKLWGSMDENHSSGGGGGGGGRSVKRKRSRFLFLVTDQLNRGSSCITTDRDRRDLIRLNNDACHLAKRRNGMDLLGLFLREALKLVDETRDWDTEYKLLLQLYETASDYEANRGSYNQSIHYSGVIIERAKRPEDSILALTTRCHVYQILLQLTESINYGRDALILCGERLPTSNVVMVSLELQKVKRLAKRWVKGKSDDELLNLPEVTDRKKVLALKTLLLMAVSAWSTDSNLMILTYIKMFQITLEFGKSRYMGGAFVGIGVLMVEAFGEIELGCRFATLGLKVEGKQPTARTIAFAYCFVLHSKIPIASMLEPLLSGYRVGLEDGDSIFGPICVALYMNAYAWSGLRLDTYVADILKFADQLRILKQEHQLGLIHPKMQLALNLTGRSPDPISITWDIAFKHGFLNKDGIPPQDHPPANLDLFYSQMLNAYVLRDMTVAETSFLKLQSLPKEKDRRFTGNHFYNYIYVLLDGMVGLWLDQMKGNSCNRRIVNKSIKWFKKHPNLNTAPIRIWLEAQSASYYPSPSSVGEVKKRYDSVIPMLTRSGLIHFSAMANEQAAEFFLRQKGGDFENDAALYLRSSVEMYSEWGASVKVQQLIQKYDCLDDSIFSKKTRSSTIQGRERFSTSRDRVAAEAAKLRKEHLENDTAASGSLLYGS